MFGKSGPRSGHPPPRGHPPPPRPAAGGSTPSTKQPPPCKFATAQPHGCTDEWCTYLHPNRPVLCHFEASSSGCTNKVNCKYFHPSKPRPVAAKGAPPSHSSSVPVPGSLLPSHGGHHPVTSGPRPFSGPTGDPTARIPNHVGPHAAPGHSENHPRPRPPLPDAIVPPGPHPPRHPTPSTVSTVDSNEPPLCRHVSTPQGCRNDMCTYTHPGRPLLCRFLTTSTGCTNDRCTYFHPKGIKKFDPSTINDKDKKDKVKTPTPQFDWKKVEDLYSHLTTFDIVRLPSQMVNILMNKADTVMTNSSKNQAIEITRLSNTSIKMLGKSNDIIKARRDLCAYSVSYYYSY